MNLLDSKEAKLVWKRYQKKIKNKKTHFIKTPYRINQSFKYPHLDNVILTKRTKKNIGKQGQDYYEDEGGNIYLYCYLCEKIKQMNSDNFYKQHTKMLGYRVPCKSCNKLIQKFKRDTNPELRERMAEQTKQWQEENKERRNETQRISRNKRMEDPEYRKKHNEYHSDYSRIRRANDPAYKIAGNVSRLVRRAIKRVNEGLTSKGGKTFDHLPYTPQELVEQLESQFDENMSWENYGDYWHIDHIIPQAMLPYDSVKHKNFQKAWALDNLQPLTVFENLSKNSIYKGKKRYYKDNH
tara:strand:+ start:269 stop:1156 length:888 start_codon:yes stop_codon:yes gene_type:complete